ncbi:MAG: nucleotidyltransferase domain-containing protein [Deltaproteobacteria bacterium]|nr:nucleotidyltransferase domain-containing protein [Deltaproteobacteria bacterium]
MNKSEIEKALGEIVKRIVNTAHPSRIILFGSAARGEMGRHSDFDLLIVVPPTVHRRMTAQKIYRNLIGVGMGADIVVVTESDIERYKNNSGLVIKPALQEGRTLYAA